MIQTNSSYRHHGDLDWLNSNLGFTSSNDNKSKMMSYGSKWRLNDDFVFSHISHINSISLLGNLEHKEAS